ncbi:hypothetical protein PMAYCL1PPCAC_08070, partial [Pristionchus mayeri]
CLSTASPNQRKYVILSVSNIFSLVLLSPHYEKEKTYDIVLLVISAEYEKEEREEIRRQWASKKESMMQKMGKSVVIFLVGQSSALDEEAAQYGDLLLVDIEESYRNLVYKIEIGFRWIKEKLQSEYVAKIDSDTVVHIDRLYNLLQRYDARSESRMWMTCYTHSGAAPMRYRYDVWYVSESDYPQDVYPRYCNGPGYVMTRETFDEIVIEVEDVFFTGIVAEDFVTHISEGVTDEQYTDYSTCDGNGPVLSILNTHYQLGWSKKSNDLTEAWERLKDPIC